MHRSVTRFVLGTGLAFTLCLSLVGGGMRPQEAQAFSTTIRVEPSGPAPIALLLPAVQSAREAAR